jgi:hypothetical protein
MLPDGKKLEELLGKLFKDDDESTSDGVMVLRKPIPFMPSGNCCSLNYGNYGDD